MAESPPVNGPTLEGVKVGGLDHHLKGGGQDHDLKVGGQDHHLKGGGS